MKQEIAIVVYAGARPTAAMVRPDDALETRQCPKNVLGIQRFGVAFGV